MKRQPGFGFETYCNISDNKFVYLCIPSNVCYDVELSLNRVMSYSKGGRIGLTSLSTGLYCSLIFAKCFDECENKAPVFF